MSTKNQIIGMTALFVVCMGYWFFLVHFVYPKHPGWMIAQNQADQTAVTAPTTEAAAMATTAGPAASEASTGPGRVAGLPRLRPPRAGGAAGGPAEIGSTQ